MRTISEIIIHCSATPAGKNYDVHDVDQWHRACPCFDVRAEF